MLLARQRKMVSTVMDDWEKGKQATIE